ncbi:MAG: hypothetical protein CVV44_04220 [Spirochaetae bacterium HGW-Spirochaetae-1]|jgi:hypothetical protein|nr:MAG: hypothetical protein CVV44_04220 [Spirochaetae bacterium HGW-Spirochaetae-1]
MEMVAGNVKKLFICSISLFFIMSVASISEGKGKSYLSSVTWGIIASPVFVVGPFQPEFNPGFQLAFNPILPLTGLVKNGNITLETAWSIIELSGNSSSFMHVFSLKGGFLYQYPLNKYVNPFAAMGMQASYFYLNTNDTDITSKTLKPGLFAEVGVLASFYRGMGSRISLEYCALPLSNLLYSEIKVKMGVTYCYDNQEGFAVKGIKEPETVSSGVVRAREAFEHGRISEARELVSAVLKKDRENKQARELADTIDRMEGAEREARRLIIEKRYLEAIPLLEQSAVYYPESRVELSRIRSEMIRMVPTWEKEGVASYESKDYDSCIVIMKKIMLVDPENNTAKIYLPRAQKRKKALESF